MCKEPPIEKHRASANGKSPYRRALGLADMAKAIATGREARCDYRQTFHVLEIIEGFETNSREGRWVKMQSHYDRKPPMKKNPLKGILD